MQKAGTQKKHMVVPLPSTPPPAYSLTFCLLPQTHFILAVFPTSNFKYTWTKKELHLCQ